MSIQGAMAPRCLGAMAPWCLGALVPWRLGALVPWCHGVMAPRCHGATVPWRHGATQPWCLGALVPWRHGALVPWRHGAKLPWCHGARISNLTKTPPWQATIRLSAFVIGGVSSIALDERTRRLANSGEVSSQNLVGFFKDECTNLFWRRAAGWLDWMGKDEPERQRAESQWIVAGKTNLSHDGLNPAHVPYWWVNNPTLGEFCFTMIGRADIEPQASYPCGNFSDTSSFEFQRSKGSLGHAFTVRIRTGNQNQKSFYPSVPYEISVLVELILGHLRYLLTDVPPQPNSPPDNVFRPDRPAERALGPKRGEVPRFRFTE
ncbi:Regulator of rDNA transcription protein 15 [Capsicum baccatum]|uniref:Regulator of rDNA transcription protein 15 n=1 Tax=Capsicum baccatum TaxID=33114 RepID=A0A2G2V0Z0_CAPBA|nr:Regulator of rDNA transcription protein 15 [Capsicum baccatum]